jgi:hypothetical protein
MNHVEPLSQRHPARMSLTPGQHSLIATAYDRGAFDVRLHQSGLCKKKADWFRLLACIGEKRAALNERVAKPKGLGATANPFGFIAT